MCGKCVNAINKENKLWEVLGKRSLDVPCLAESTVAGEESESGRI